MSKTFSGGQVIRALKRIGYKELYTRGSHVFLFNEILGLKIVVPKHKELKKGTLSSILKKTSLSIEALKKLI